MELIKVSKPFIDSKEVEEVSKVLLSGQYVSGKKVKEFENKFADYIGVNYAIAVNSGTAALHTSLAVLGVGPGDEVIVPPLTFFSTVTSVIHQNAIPVFADIDIDDFCLNPLDVQSKITDKTKAVIPVHLWGNSAKMHELRNICEKANIFLIEDCAQAHGTSYRGKKVGSLGDIGAFSFYATKHMTTGEGGILTTDNEEWANCARMIRSHGMSGRDDHIVLGYNYRMNEIAAAIGIVQLEKLDYLNLKRIDNSKYILDNLKSNKPEWCVLPILNNEIEHTFFWCPMLIDEEKLGMSTADLVKKLRRLGIETRHRYNTPLYNQKILNDGSNPKLKSRRYYSLSFTNVEKIIGKVIGLPNHADLKTEELDYIIETIRSI